MLAHQPEVTRMIHRERVQQLADDAQQPMESVSLPAHHFGVPHMLTRLAALAHIGSVLHHRGVDTRT